MRGGVRGGVTQVTAHTSIADQDVPDCWISGDIATHPSSLQQQALAVHHHHLHHHCQQQQNTDTIIVRIKVTCLKYSKQITFQVPDKQNGGKLLICYPPLIGPLIGPLNGPGLF